MTTSDEWNRERKCLCRQELSQICPACAPDAFVWPMGAQPGVKQIISPGWTWVLEPVVDIIAEAELETLPLQNGLWLAEGGRDSLL